jgi:hypothetical protein
VHSSLALSTPRHLDDRHVVPLTPHGRVLRPHYTIGLRTHQTSTGPCSVSGPAAASNQFSNDYPITPLPVLPATATPLLSLHAPQLSPQHLHHQHSSSRLPVHPPSRPPVLVSTIPSKYLTHLPPWNNRSFVTTNAPHWSQDSTLPDRRCGRLIEQTATHSLRLVHTVCRRTTSLRLLEVPQHSTTSTRHSCRCTPPFAVSNCSSLRLFGPIKTVSIQIQTSIPLHLHKTRPSPPVTAAVLSLSGGSSSAAFFQSSSPSSRQ